MSETHRKLIIISLDAVTTADALKLSAMPRFGSLCARGTLVTDVQSVFISNTYPCHASILTGKHPYKHGVTENTIYEHGAENPEWRWHRSHMKGQTLPDEAKKNGRTVCSLLWPVMGGADIDWNLPEIPVVRKGQNQILMTLKNGTAGFLLHALLKHFREYKGISQPSLDNFVTSVATGTILKHKPDLMLLHLTDVDTQKHEYGPDSFEANEALERHDKRLGTIIDAVWAAGLADRTDYIILGDHGCLPVTRTVDLNTHLGDFARHGGFHQAGGCAFFKLNEKGGEDLNREGALLLKKIIDDPKCGVSRILTDDEMAVSGLNREFDVGLEAAEGVCFGKEHLGQHGYALDHKGYNTFYLAAGAHIPEGHVQSGGCIVDICPLALKIMDLKKWDMDGVLRIEMG